MRQNRARCAERLLSAALPYGCSWPDTASYRYCLNGRCPS